MKPPPKPPARRPPPKPPAPPASASESPAPPPSVPSPKPPLAFKTLSLSQASARASEFKPPSTPPAKPQKRHVPGVPDTPGSAAEPAIEVDKPAKYFAGDVIAQKYQLTSLIGEGGMGAVWMARNLSLDADVCVKLIRREAATPRASQRLLREARAAAKLTHPSIVRVFDFGETEYRDPFIVMEMLRGDSLRRMLERKGRLSPLNAVATILPVASALVEAHAKDIVHRDLKPENIVLVEVESGAVLPKIVDFGIAKLRHDEGARRFTQHNAVLGSPDYMSPEQARGDADVDHRTDVWALAVVLYEAMVGRLPFLGENYNALLYAIQHEDPIPTSDVGAGNKDLWSVIAHALTKKPEDRWPDMRSFGTALARWAVDSDLDVDITGASIALGWLSQPRNPFSEMPQQRAQAHSSPKLDTLSQEDIEAASRKTDPAPTPLPPPPAAAASGPGKTKGWLWGTLGLLVAAGAGVALWRVAGAGSVTVEPPSASAPTAAPAAGAATAGASPATSSSAQPEARGDAASATVAAPAPGADASASPVAAAPPAATPAPAGDLVSCVTPLFAEATFREPEAASLGFLCEETDPRVAAPRLKEQIVLSRGPAITAGMKEWSAMSWYEMAAVAILRARCCPGAPALTLPSNGGTCPALEEVLTELGRVAASGKDATAELKRHDEAVLCLVRTGGAVHYSYPLLARLDQPRAVFDKTLARARTLTPLP